MTPSTRTATSFIRNDTSARSWMTAACGSSDGTRRARSSPSTRRQRRTRWRVRPASDRASTGTCCRCAWSTVEFLMIGTTPRSPSIRGRLRPADRDNDAVRRPWARGQQAHRGRHPPGWTGAARRECRHLLRPEEQLVQGRKRPALSTFVLRLRDGRSLFTSPDALPMGATPRDRLSFYDPTTDTFSSSDESVPEGCCREWIERADGSLLGLAGGAEQPTTARCQQRGWSADAESAEPIGIATLRFQHDHTTPATHATGRLTCPPRSARSPRRRSRHPGLRPRGLVGDAGGPAVLPRATDRRPATSTCAKRPDRARRAAPVHRAARRPRRPRRDVQGRTRMPGWATSASTTQGDRRSGSWPTRACCACRWSATATRSPPVRPRPTWTAWLRPSSGG